MRTKLFLPIFLTLAFFYIKIGFADIKFTDISLQAGIKDASKGACLALADYDGDGFVDIYVGNNGKFPEVKGMPNILYKNLGNGNFTDVAVKAGVADDRQTQGVVWGDFNNDGYPDLYVVNDFALNALYLNNGDGSFKDITNAAGVKGGIDIAGGDEIPNGYSVTLADIDNDGYLDIYVVNLGSANMLYRNNGDGAFTDITDQANVKAGVGPMSAGTAAVFSDFDNDGKPDLFAVNGYGLPSFLYINTGNGFKDFTDKAGIGENGDAQGVAVGDYDNDGNMDIYVSNFASPEGAPLQNTLYRNNGKGVFQDVTAQAGLARESYSIGAVFGDLDNDGYLDLYVINSGEPNILYRNKGNGTFEDITDKAGVGNINLGTIAALADINNDGYLDIYVANSGFSNEKVGETDILYSNNGGTNNWLQVSLKGTMSNRMGIGVRIKASIGNLHLTREVSGGTGYCQNSPIANFGLGVYEKVDKLEVIWSSGIVQTLNNIKANQRIIVEEGNQTPVQLYDMDILAWGKVKQLEQENRKAFRPPISELKQNYPNPFNPETWIPYHLSQDSPVTISIYNFQGQLVRNLELGNKDAGEYLSKEKAAYWDGRDSQGEYLSSGVYFYQIKTDGFTDIKKMLLIR